MAPVGMLKGVMAAELTMKLGTNPLGNSLAGTTELMLDTKSRKCAHSPIRVEPGLKIVEPGRPVLVVGHVVFPCPQEFDWNTGLSGCGSFLGDEAGNPGDLDVIVTH